LTKLGKCGIYSFVNIADFSMDESTETEFLSLTSDGGPVYIRPDLIVGVSGLYVAGSNNRTRIDLSTGSSVLVKQAGAIIMRAINAKIVEV
jgi:hypothetical protein